MHCMPHLRMKRGRSRSKVPSQAQLRAAQVRADKLREVTAGHDGTWVAHPDLVTVALEIFNQ
eukprot:352561-Chlamydomonas_euryale.AAC.5